MYNTTFTIVDDTSPSITYSGVGWFTGGTLDEYNSTTHGTGTVGSIATFTFNGSIVEVFGTVGREQSQSTFAATSSYTIDNDSNSTVQFTGNLGSVTLYKQLFYTSDVLNEGPHTLFIAYMTPDKNTLWLDYFRVTSVTQLNTTSLSSSDQPTCTSASASASAASPSSSPLSTEGMAGIAIGGCATLVLLIIMFLLLHSLTRKLKSKAVADSMPKQDRENRSHFFWFWKGRKSPPVEITPFDPYTAGPSLNTRKTVGFTTRGGRSSDKRV